MNDKRISEEDAISLLKKYSKSQKDFNIILKHSKKVQEVSLRFANYFLKNNLKNKEDVDLELIRIGSLLHDIGRLQSKEEPIRHGIVGYEILINETKDKELANISRVHIGSGITKLDVVLYNLNLEKKDYLPKTIEEKIITYADNLIDLDKEKDFDYVLKRYINELGFFNIGRSVKLHNFIMELISKKHEKIDLLCFDFLFDFIDVKKQEEVLKKIFQNLYLSRNEFSEIINNFVPFNLVFYERDSRCYLKMSVNDLVKNKSNNEKKEFIISVTLGKLSKDSSIKEVCSSEDSLIEFTKEETSNFLFHFDKVFNSKKALLNYLKSLNQYLILNHR